MSDKEPDAPNGRMSNFAIAEFVGAKIDSAKDDIRRELKLYVGLGLVSGQVLAGLVAAIVTRTTPADASRAAAELVARIF